MSIFKSKFNTCFEKASAQFKTDNFHESFAYAQASLEHTDRPDEIGRAYSMMAESMLRAGGRNVRLSKPLEKRVVAAPCHGPIVEAHYFQLLQQATLWFEKSGDHDQVVAILFGAASEYMRRGDYHNAIEFFNRCAHKARSIHDKHNFANCMGELGDLAASAGRHHEALKYTWNAYKIFQEEGSPQKEIAKQVLHELKTKIGADSHERMLADVKKEPLW